MCFAFMNWNFKGGMMVTIIFSDYYVEDRSRLTDNERYHLEDLERRIRYNRLTPGSGEETIKCRNGKDVHTFRVNRDIRLAVYRWKQDEYMLLMCDHHDELYKRLKRIDLREVKEGDPPIIVEVVVHKCEHTHVVSNLSLEPSVPQFKNRFKELPLEKIMAIGVSQDLAQRLQLVTSEDEIQDVLAATSERVFGALVDVNDNIACYDETLIKLRMPERPRKSIVKILKDSPELRAHYFILTDDLLERFMNGMLENWQVFLHPTQMRAVEMQVNGPMMVTGPAGTGKTVVAVHRVKWLLKNRFHDETQKILFTTFTRTLASSGEMLLRKICTSEEMERVDVTHVDEFMRGLIDKYLNNTEICYNTGIIKFSTSTVPYACLIREVCANGIPGGKSLDFIAREFEHVIAEYEISSKDEYLNITRPKILGVLQSTTREKLWPIFEALNRRIDSCERVPRAVASNRLRKVLPFGGCDYRAIVVDEAQDLGAPEYRLFAHLTGNTFDTPRPDSLCFTGDGHQRIYGRAASLRDCGINVKGRSAHLTMCYRSPRKIREYAEKLLKDISVENIDKEADSLKKSTSLEEGFAPEIKLKANESDKIKLMEQQLRKWIENGVKPQDCVILARRNKIAEEIQAKLARKGLNIEVITKTNGKLDTETIKVMTMHRTKGLQFVNVIVDVTEWPYLDGSETDEEAQKATLQKEKCLLYMSIMRALKNVLITSSAAENSYLPKVDIY